MFPKYHYAVKEMVKAVNDDISNNGPLPTQVRIGKAYTHEFVLVGLETVEWSEGTEVRALLEQGHEPGNPQLHMTLTQAQINGLWRQCGYTARDFQTTNTTGAVRH